MEMSVVDDRSTVAALTGLLRDELRKAQFHVSHLTRSEVKLTQGPHGGGTSTTLDPTLVEIWDADGLTALHADGGWRRSLFRSEIFVKILPRGPDSDTHSVRFERVLHDLGVVSDGCVGLALAPLLPVCTFPSHPLDYPEAVWERVETSELWRYLLVDACLGSPRRTASKLVRWARGGRLAFETRVVLGRLCASEPFSLSNGLGIGVLPRTSSDLGEWLPAGLDIVGLDIATSDYLGRTILRIPCTVAPCLTKPPPAAGQPAEALLDPCQLNGGIELNWGLPPGGISKLIRALSLVCNVAVETPLIWTNYGKHVHFGERHGVVNMGTGEPLPPRTEECELTADNLKEAIRLQPHVHNPPRDVETALRYWLKSKDQRLELADRLIYLRTALEALFLDRHREQGEFTFRLATNGAWYTGRNRVERRNRYDVLKNVYGAASKAVHGVGMKNGAAGLLVQGQDICREGIMKRIRSKQQPEWLDIVFGR